MLSFLLVLELVLVALPSGAQAQDAAPAFDQTRVHLYFFTSPTCPHCARARAFLTPLLADKPAVKLHDFELDGDPIAERAFVDLTRSFGIDPPSVPLIVVGGQVFLGYDTDASTGAEIEKVLQRCLQSPCVDPAAPIIAAATREAEGETPVPDVTINRTGVPNRLSVPLLGEVETKSLSLPVLTIVLAAIDGFNPCAMWVLIFLIGLLLGLNDPVRMWTYGAVFLITSGVVYFLFIAAWLNLFLFLGTLAWVRIAVGGFALLAGGYNLIEFVRNPDAACTVTSPEERRRVMDRLRDAVNQRSFLLAILGIVVLAVAVNMIEFLCSAGIPAVYTQMLSLSDLSTPAYYAYLALYIFVFMLDDAIVFIAAMATLQASGLAATYSRYSHLIGGVVLAAIGLLLILRPELLAFA
ncbi:glutaredoxin [Methyloligella sp. 2.7D]|uniref:glutaredoxin family protein n=1 Tax=unclassified Methyloligella TaxID=2625955 RepID=UPI00157DC265|nr:glutaredoxin [Methyloligella sp. GL2]QKP78432.1 glutaredoxin [Methyloligella sp. GL2]